MLGRQPFLLSPTLCFLLYYSQDRNSEKKKTFYPSVQHTQLV